MPKSHGNSTICLLTHVAFHIALCPAGDWDSTFRRHWLWEDEWEDCTMRGSQSTASGFIPTSTSKEIWEQAVCTSLQRNIGHYSIMELARLVESQHLAAVADPANHRLMNFFSYTCIIPHLAIIWSHPSAGACSSQHLARGFRRKKKSVTSPNAASTRSNSPDIYCLKSAMFHWHNCRGFLKQ